MKASLPRVLTVALVWLLGASAGLAQFIDPFGPTTNWLILRLSSTNQSDYFNDQQTGGKEADIVGTSNTPAFYFRFETTNGNNATNGLMAFRVRLAREDNPPGYSGVLLVGIDGNQDGKIDIFTGVDNSGSSAHIRVWKAGSGLNISPNTTTIDNTPLFSIAHSATNYSWMPVTTTNDPGVLTTDVDGDGRNDYFLTFVVPFEWVVGAFTSVGISNVVATNPLAYLALTATQPNSFNQDILGLPGDLNSTNSFLSTGTYTPPSPAINLAPTNLTLFPTVVAENQPVSTTVGDFTTFDPNANNTHTYTLVAGIGDTHNALFSITNNLLLTAAVFDFEATNSFSIRVRTTDQGGLFYETNFTITITDVNERPVLSLAIPDQSATYGTPFSYTFPSGTFTDEDFGQILSYTATNLPPGITFDAGTRTFSGTPAATGTFAITVTATDDGAPPLSTNDVFDLVVAPATLNVTADDKSRPAGQANPPLTYTLSGFVLGDTTNAVTGAPELSTTATPASPQGTYPITVAQGTLAASNYTFNLVNGTLTVTAAAPDVTWNPLGPITYGTPLGTNQLNATSSVPGTFTYNPDTGAHLPAGTNLLTLTFTPDDTNSFSIVHLGTNLVVLPANLAVTAQDAERGYGEPNPVFAYTITGFVLGETTNVVSGAPDLTTPATPASPVGTYPINIGLGTLAASNYTFTLIGGTLTVTGAVPVITWEPAGPIIYGTPLGGGQLNATSSVPGAFSYAPDTGVILNAGTNLLTAVFVPDDTNNYAPVNLTTNLVVLPALLSVTASNQTRPYNTANPPLTFGYSGFVAGDTASNALSGAPELSTPATMASPVGDYPITVGPGTLGASNYIFALNDGVLTVTPGVPGITWVPQGPIVYGTPLGTNQLNATADVPGTFDYTPTNGVFLPAGTNILVLIFTPADTNYATVTSSVPFLILKAPLTVTADNQTAPVGGPLPPLTLSYSGFILGDTPAVLDVPPTATTPATTNSPAGLYPIIPAGGADDNYTFAYVNGTLTLGVVTPTLHILRPIDGFTTFNPQTSLFEQTVLLSNHTTATFTALRLVVSGLPPTVTLHNAHGLNGAGDPYVDLFLTLPPGGTVTVLLEYFSQNRQPFAPPTLSVEPLGIEPPSQPPDGTVTAIDRAFMAANGRFYLEWQSQTGKTYYVQYADNPLGPWKTVWSPVAGTGARLVWIDDGPPKTESPGNSGRYYRLIVQ